VDSVAMMSILIATVAVPAVFARDPSAFRGLKRMLLSLLVFNALYIAYVTLIHVTYFVPQPWQW
jgi:hypothetical protein